MSMLHAHCDESYSGDLKNTPLYVVAGFVAEAHQWELFESLWKESMRDLRIQHIGSHAAKCAYGGKGYSSMTSEKRREIQHRILVDMVACRLYGAVAIIDTHAYRDRKHRINATLRKQDRKYNEPHVLAVKQCVQFMCQLTESTTTEPIAFVFDRNDAFGKRAEEWYRLDQKHPDLRYYARLGPFTHDDRMRAVGLQAADMLAYSAFRHFSGRKSWAWKILTDALKINVLETNADFWEAIASRFEGEQLRADDARE